jgi:ParB-like chromosome segregation protein Spo0J
MIQGETSTVRISDIRISRDERLRRELKPDRVAALAESISRLGLIHFPVITREMELVSGETRLAAMTSLGWDRTSIVWADTLEPDELLAIELEENIKRSDLSWQEQCEGVKRFHALQRRHEPTWTQSRTAEALGLSQKTVSEYLAIAEELASGNARVAAAPLLSTAKNVAARAQSRRQSDEAALLRTIEGDINVLAPDPAATPILNTDFADWVFDYEGPPFNLLHCDFPYGINADKFNQSAGAELGTYADTFDTYARLIETLIQNKERLLGDSAHIIFWFSMQHYDYTLRTLRAHFRVDPYPLIWLKSNNRGTLPDPNRGPRRIYEVAFLCSHGDRKIITPTSNAFAAPTPDSEHMSEKSQEMLEYFFRMVVDEHTRLLDPTCGSGSALRAADKMGAASVLGLEVNPEFASNARRAWERRNG